MKKTKQLTIAALLMTIGIIIPMVMPKLHAPFATYTLGSHVALMIAMFISPTATALVAVGTAYGFLITTGDLVALRALSHIVFALCGSFYIAKHKDVLSTPAKLWTFSLWIGLIHVVMECIVVYLYYFGGTQSGENFFVTVILAVGIGGLIHSLVDFFIGAKVVTVLKLDK